VVTVGVGYDSGKPGKDFTPTHAKIKNAGALSAGLAYDNCYGSIQCYTFTLAAGGTETVNAISAVKKGGGNYFVSNPESDNFDVYYYSA